MAGTLRDRAGLVVLGAWALSLLAVPLMLGFSGYLLLLCATCFLLALRELSPGARAAVWGARGLALLVLVAWAAQRAAAYASGIRAFLGFTLFAGVVPAAMMYGAWAPPGATSA